MIDWIPAHLSKSTQAALRNKMAELPSNNDNPGYVYAFEIRGMLAYIILRGTYRTYCCRFKLRRSDKIATESWLHRRFTQTHGPMAEAMLLTGAYSSRSLARRVGRTPQMRHRRGNCLCR